MNFGIPTLMRISQDGKAMEFDSMTVGSSPTYAVRGKSLGKELITMQQNSERIKTVLSPISRQSIASMLMNYVSSIPDGEEIEISFFHNESDGKSHIYLDAIRKSRTPDIQKSIELTQTNLDVKFGKGEHGKGKDKPDKQST